MTYRNDIYPSPDLDPQIALLLAVLEDATQEWRRYLEDITDDVVVWQPFPDGHSIGTLILHIAEVEARWIHEVGGGHIVPDDQLAILLANEIDQEFVKWPTPPAKPLSWYFEQHAMVRTKTCEVLAEVNDPDHIGVIEDEEFTLRWLVNHVISHEAYHGGQAVLLSLIYQKTVAEAPLVETTG